MKSPASFATLATAAFAVVTAAQHGVYGKSIGSSVGPGRVISKQERSQLSAQRRERMDSVTETTDGQADEKLDYEVQHDWAALKAKFEAKSTWPHTLERLGVYIDDNFVPGCAVARIPGYRTSRRPYSLTSLICTAILLLLVFGILYNLVEYLLSATRASACSVTTVYIPVTYTVTKAISEASSLTTANDTSPTVTYTSTTTHTTTIRETLTSTIAVASTSALVSPLSSTAGPTYFYTVNSAGQTDWVNGVSPSSGASLTTVTTTVVVQPVPPTNPAVVSESTATHTETVTPPAYTSTVYSFQRPDITSTSTSTHYETYTLSQVSRSRTTTTTRTSFAGLGSSGWNTTTANDPSLNASKIDPVDPISTTITAIGYFGVGDDISSTTTMFITTTLAVEYTTTIQPTVAQASSRDLSVATVTVLPATITPGSSMRLTSASLQPPSTGPDVYSLGTALTSSLYSMQASSVGIVVSTSLAHSVTATFSSGIHSVSSYLTTSNIASTPSLAKGNSTSQSTFTSNKTIEVSTSTTGSIDMTFSAGAITATQSSLTSPFHDSTLPASIPSYPTSTPQITATLSGPMSTRSAANTSEGMLGSSKSPVSSNSTFSFPSTESASNTHSDSTAISPASASQPHRSSTIPPTLSASSPGASSSPHGFSSVSLSLMSSLSSKTTQAKGIPLTIGLPMNSTSLPIMNSFTTKTTRAKGTPLIHSLTSNSTSLPAVNTSTSKTSRLKGTPMTLSHTSSSVSLSTVNSDVSMTSTRVKGTPLIHSPSKSSLQSGTTTSVQSSEASMVLTTYPLPTTSSTLVLNSTSGSVAGSSSYPTRSFETSQTTSSPIALATSHTLSSTAIIATKPSLSSFVTATPTAGCGEQGDFLFTFDNLPDFIPTHPNTTSITQAPPIFSPYHHLTFSDGYVYAPAPSEPYQPVSPPHLAVFLANATGKVSGQSGNLSQPGEIGDGPLDPTSAFWFDVQSAYFGCDNLGPQACTLVFSAFTWNSTANTEMYTYGQNATILPCTTMNDLNCKMQRVEFPSTFQNLTGLQIQAYVGNGQRMFFMDNLALSWSNSSCAAGLLRQSSR